MEVLNVCRSCIKILNISEKVPEPKTMKMFTYCTNIQIAKDEFTPKKFCQDCTNQIESLYNFIKRAQAVNITLQEMIKKNKSSVIVEQSINKDVQSIFNNEISNQVNIDSDKSLKNEDLDSDPKEEPFSNDNKLIKSKFKVNCPKCNKGFISKIWFKKHVENECSDRDFECNICKKKFTKKSKLREHKTSHIEQNHHICNMCGRQFQKRKQLTAHIVTHSVERPYTCDVCSKSFKLKRVLAGHMKIHQEVKPYLCSFCGWSTTQSHNLSVHMSSHTGAKPFACDACSFRSCSRSSLARHALRHALHRPAAYPCAHCGKLFRDNSSLSRHRRTHTGERPYVCPRCPRGFADSWKRKHHLMRAHGLGLADIPRMRMDGQPY